VDYENEIHSYFEDFAAAQKSKKASPVLKDVVFTTARQQGASISAIQLLVSGMIPYLNKSWKATVSLPNGSSSLYMLDLSLFITVK